MPNPRFSAALACWRPGRGRALRPAAHNSQAVEPAPCSRRTVAVAIVQVSVSAGRPAPPRRTWFDGRDERRAHAGDDGGTAGASGRVLGRPSADVLGVRRRTNALAHGRVARRPARRPRRSADAEPARILEAMYAASRRAIASCRSTAGYRSRSRHRVSDSAAAAVVTDADGRPCSARRSAPCGRGDGADERPDGTRDYGARARRTTRSAVVARRSDARMVVLHFGHTGRRSAMLTHGNLTS